MIETEFDYSKEALKKFLKFHLLMKEKVKTTFYITSSIFVLLGLILVIFFRRDTLGFLSIVIAIILFLLFPLLVNKNITKTVNSYYKRNPQSIIFYDTKIIQMIDGKNVEHNWLDIIEVDETKEYLYLYFTKKSALIVEKEKLEKSKYDELIKMIKDHVGEIILYKNY